MRVDKILTTAKQLISKGEIDQAINTLSTALAACRETPFHPILQDTFGPGLATKTKQFLLRQQKRQKVEMVMFLLGDITVQKQWVQWMCAFDTYSPPYRRCVLKPPCAKSTTVLLHQLSKVSQGFATRYQRKEFPDEAEIAKLLVYAKLIQAFARVARKEFERIEANIVVTSEGAEVYGEFRNGEWVAQPKDIEGGSVESGTAAINCRVRARVGKRTKARFSAYNVFPSGVLVDNLDDIAIIGRAVVVADAAPDWGGSASTSYQSEVLENPTWLDLCEVLDKQIEATRDQQHVFLEGVEKCGSITIDGTRAHKYRLTLGS